MHACPVPQSEFPDPRPELRHGVILGDADDEEMPVGSRDLRPELKQLHQALLAVQAGVKERHAPPGEVPGEGAPVRTSRLDRMLGRRIHAVRRDADRLVESERGDVACLLFACRMPTGDGTKDAGMQESVGERLARAVMAPRPRSHHAARGNHQRRSMEPSCHVGVVERPQPQGVVVHQVNPLSL